MNYFGALAILEENICDFPKYYVRDYCKNEELFLNVLGNQRLLGSLIIGTCGDDVHKVNIEENRLTLDSLKVGEYPLIT